MIVYPAVRMIFKMGKRSVKIQYEREYSDCRR